jgi:ECF sigma factor
VEPDSQTVTLLLQSWSQGDESTIEKLMPIVNDELRRLARRYMAGAQSGHTLQPTELVNEAYLRLVPSAQLRWECRTQFFRDLRERHAPRSGGSDPSALRFRELTRDDLERSFHHNNTDIGPIGVVQRLPRCLWFPLEIEGLISKEMPAKVGLTCSLFIAILL